MPIPGMKNIASSPAVGSSPGSSLSAWSPGCSPGSSHGQGSTAGNRHGGFKAVSLSQIQAEEEAKEKMQEFASGPSRWYVERRPRADSLEAVMRAQEKEQRDRREAEAEAAEAAAAIAAVAASQRGHGRHGAGNSSNGGGRKNKAKLTAV